MLMLKEAVLLLGKLFCSSGGKENLTEIQVIYFVFKVKQKGKNVVTVRK
jgi:hypothetical protein